jgi:mannosyltransferase
VKAGAVADAPLPAPAWDLPRVRHLDRIKLILVSLTVLAAVVRFWRIGHQSFWFDEGFTVADSHASFRRMLGLVHHVELTPPLYFCVAWIWSRIFGLGEVALRSLSAVAGVAMVPATYLIAAKLISRRVALLAAALVACNPFLIWYSQEARSYITLALFGTLSLLAFVCIRLPNPSGRWLAAWAVAASLTITTHYYGALAVVPQAIWLLWIHRSDRRVRWTLGAVGVVGLALLPLAVGQRHHANWIAIWPLHLRLGQILPQYLLGTGAPARTWLKLAGGLAALLSLVLFAFRTERFERGGALVVGALGAAGFLLSVALLLAGSDQLITRNIIVVLVPLIIVVATGLGARGSGKLGLVGAATLCAVGLAAAIAVAVTPSLERPNWRAAARLIKAGPPASAGRALLIQDYHPHGLLMPLPIYLPHAHHMQWGALVNELDLIAVTSPRRTYFCWWGSACNLLDSDLRSWIRVPGLQPVGPVLHADQLSILRMRSSGPIFLRRRVVKLAFASSELGSYALVVVPPA